MNVPPYIQPIYLVVDESMPTEPHLEELSSGLDRFLTSMHNNPFSTLRVRFSIIGFSNTARTHLRSADLRTITALPPLMSRGPNTSFKAAFEELHVNIRIDVPHLKSAGSLVYRPYAILLLNSVPNIDDNWQPALQSILDDQFWPHILGFGLSESDPASIRHIATAQQYAAHQDAGIDTSTALHNFTLFLERFIANFTMAHVGPHAIELPHGFSASISNDADKRP